MACRSFDENPASSDEEQELFAGFTIEEIGQIRRDREARLAQQQPHDLDDQIEEFLDLRPTERGSNSDVELYASEEEEEESNESSDEEATPDNAGRAPPNAIQWSNNLSGINVEPFSIGHGPNSDLGDNPTAKDYFNPFIDDNYIDEIVRCTIAYARSKRDQNFTTT